MGDYFGSSSVAVCSSAGKREHRDENGRRIFWEEAEKKGKFEMMMNFGHIMVDCQLCRESSEHGGIF